MQQPEAIQRVNVYRPPEYFIGPEAQPEIAESMLNRYRMVVQPLFFDEQRCSFQLRAPGLGVLCSRNMFIEASFKIRCPGRLNFATSKSAIAGIFDNTAIENVNAAGVNETQRMGYGAKICFGGGDAITGAVSNIQLVVNGAAISNSRQRTYSNALDRVWFADDVFQRRFSCAGGVARPT